MRRAIPYRSISSRRIPVARRCSTNVTVLALSLLSLVLLEGCATYYVARWEAPPEGQERINVGTTRSVVEEILGDPVAKLGPVHTYEYSTREGRPFGWASVPVTFALDFLTAGMMAVGYRDMDKAYRSQRSRRQLVYSPDDRVIALLPHVAEGTFERWLKADERAANLEYLCQAGNVGSADAHAVQAVRYRYGLWGTEVDPAKAYLSIRLAAFFGNPGATQAIEDWRAGMTTDEVAKADRQYVAWQPTPCNED